MLRSTARLALVAALSFGCGDKDGNETPYVVLRIEDPSNVAATGSGAAALVLTDGSGNQSRFDGLPHGFPVTVTVTSERRGAQQVTVDLYAATTLLARGSTTIDVVAQNTQEVEVALVSLDTPPPPPPPPPPCDPGLGCPQDTSPCKNELNAVTVELDPDGTNCTQEDGQPGACYAGECRDLDFRPTCDQHVSLGEIFSDGFILGGPGHGITVNDLTFQESDSAGFDPQWVVANDDIRPGDTPAPHDAVDYTIYIVDPLELASFRIRTQAGIPCQFHTAPDATNTSIVRSTSFATITLQQPGLGNQMVRFYFTCDAGGLDGLRLDDFCLVGLR